MPVKINVHNSRPICVDLVTFQDHYESCVLIFGLIKLWTLCTLPIILNVWLVFYCSNNSWRNLLIPTAAQVHVSAVSVSNHCLVQSRCLFSFGLEAFSNIQWSWYRYSYNTGSSFYSNNLLHKQSFGRNNTNVNRDYCPKVLTKQSSGVK